MTLRDRFARLSGQERPGLAAPSDGVDGQDLPESSATVSPADPQPAAVTGGDSGDPSAPAGGDSTGEKSLVRFEVTPGTLDVTDHPLQFAFGHGRHHGEWRIDSEPYAAYLALKAEEEALGERAGWCREEMAEERVARVEAAELHGRLASKRVAVRHAGQAVERAEAHVAAADGAIAQARQALIALKGRGSRTYLAIYGLAGAVFIVGDVALAKYTVSTALRLKGWEGWAFAIGLALLAVVLKPVYDRLVEDRYHEGKTKAFVWSILASALLVAVFLLVMGGYRADFMQSNVGLTQDRGALELLDRRIERARSLEQPDQVAALEAERTEVSRRVRTNETALLTNRTGYIALVLSQLLFAVAGAICLGLATRNLRDWQTLQRPLRARLGKAKHEQDPQNAGTLFRQRMDAVSALDGARNQVQEHEQDKERLDATVASLESEAEALQRINAARERYRDSQESLLGVRTKLYGHLYQSGYGMGAKLPEPEITSRGDGQSGWLPDASGLEISPGGNGRSGRRRHRPYLAVREAVRRAAIPPGDDFQ